MIARRKLWFVLAVLVFILSACTPAAPAAQPTQVAPSAVSALPTQPPATSTPEPTATQPPTATPLLPTATAVPPTPTATTPPGVSVSWCVLRDKLAAVKASADPMVMPEGASAGVLADGVLTLLTPSATCTIVFTLPADAAQGAILEVMDGTNAVWLKSPLQPSSSNPGQSFVVLTHSYLVEPPYWTIFYPARVVSANGTTLWSANLEMRYYWQPAKCWDGTMPNIKTLACKKQQDLHPWDPAYTPPPPGSDPNE